MIRRIVRFVTGLLIRLLLDPAWCIAAVVLLVLHFRLGISIWWFAGVVALWAAWVLLRLRIFRWAADCGSRKDPPKENKNPYSVKK